MASPIACRRGARRRRAASAIIVALVVSMMLTLFARLYYVQLLDPNKPVQTAHLLHDGAIVHSRAARADRRRHRAATGRQYASHT